MAARSLLSVLPDAQIWTQMTQMRTQSRMMQAGLIVVPSALQLAPFLDRILAQIVCLDPHGPCGSCRMCLHVLSDSHPDIRRVHPDNPAGVIKIEQIRELQTTAYQTPQLGGRQVFLLYPVEAMNHAAASALLKILEEPAASTVFILVTTNPSLILPTIVSRCQQIHVQTESQPSDPVSLGKAYPEASPRGMLYAQRLKLFEQLDSLLAKRLSPCDVAAQWSEAPIQDMLWFFTGVMTKLIQLRVLPSAVLETEYQGYGLFAHRWRPDYLYAQLDSVYAILSQLQHNINLNAALVWERILLSFLEDYSRC